MNERPSPQERLVGLAAASAQQLSDELVELLGDRGALAEELRAHAVRGPRQAPLPRPALDRLERLIAELGTLGVPEAAPGLRAAAALSLEHVLDDDHSVPKQVRQWVSDARMGAREAFVRVGPPADVAADVAEWLRSEPEADQARRYASWLEPLIEAPEAAPVKDELRWLVGTLPDDQLRERPQLASDYEIANLTALKRRMNQVRANAALGLAGATDEETLQVLAAAAKEPGSVAHVHAAAVRAIGPRAGADEVVRLLSNRFEAVRLAALDVAHGMVVDGVEMSEETRAAAKAALWNLHVAENNDGGPKAFAALARLAPEDVEVAMRAEGLATSPFSSEKDRAAALEILYADDLDPERLNRIMSDVVVMEPSERVADVLRGLPAQRRAEIEAATVRALDDHAVQLAARRSLRAIPGLTGPEAVYFQDLTEAANTLELMTDLGIQPPADVLRPVIEAIDGQLVPTQPNRPIARALRAAARLAPEAAGDDQAAQGLHRAVASARAHLTDQEAAPQFQRLTHDVEMAERNAVPPTEVANLVADDPARALEELRTALTSGYDLAPRARKYLAALHQQGVDVSTVVADALPERIAELLPDVAAAVGADRLVEMAGARPELVAVVASEQARTIIDDEGRGPEAEGDDMGGPDGGPGGTPPSLGPAPLSGPDDASLGAPPAPEAPPALLGGSGGTPDQDELDGDGSGAAGLRYGTIDYATLEAMSGPTDEVQVSERDEPVMEFEL